MSQRESEMICSSRLLEVHVHRVGDAQLLGQVAVVDLDVAGLVGHLVRGVPLGLLGGGRLHDLGGGDQRPLLAVQELGEHPRVHVDVELDLLRGLELARGLQHLGEELRRLGRGADGHHLLEVDGGRPVEIRRVPGERLPLLVEREQVLLLERVAPVENRIQRRAHRLGGARGGEGERVVLPVVHWSLRGGRERASRYHNRRPCVRKRSAQRAEGERGGGAGCAGAVTVRLDRPTETCSNVRDGGTLPAHRRDRGRAGRAGRLRGGPPARRGGARRRRARHALPPLPQQGGPAAGGARAAGGRARGAARGAPVRGRHAARARHQLLPDHDPGALPASEPGARPGPRDRHRRAGARPRRSRDSTP